jgi:hypothetical protein
VRWPQFGSQHCLPASLRSTIITRFFATTDALTPAGPFVITHRGSLIHVTRTSHHSVSNHLRFSTRRVPLPQRWPRYFVRASPCARKLARTADRIEFTLSVLPDGRRYGLMVHFQLLSTRGYCPDAVTFSYWPFSVGQVRDFHPAVPVRSQAHERRQECRRSKPPGSGAQSANEVWGLLSPKPGNPRPRPGVLNTPNWHGVATVKVWTWYGDTRLWAQLVGPQGP